MTSQRGLLGIIGGGNMGKAIALGALDAKLLAPPEIVFCEPDSAKRDALSRWGIGACATVEQLADRLVPPPPGEVARRGIDFAHMASFGGQVLLAVKPQSLADVAAHLRPLLETTPRVVISVLAGTPTAKIAGMLGDQNPVIRVMPNTPARLRKGMSAICLGAAAEKAHATLAYDLFASVGEVVKIDESLMDAFTALSGSGPAYLFYLAEAMINAAAEVGFDRISADRIVRQTITGAAALLAESSEPPESLRAAVTSKGGTTEAACAVLDRERVCEAVVAAVVAGRDRGRQLGTQ